MRCLKFRKCQNDFWTICPEISSCFNQKIKNILTATYGKMKICYQLPVLNFGIAFAPRSNEERILSFVASNGYIVRGDVDLLLGVSQATSNRILKRMVTDGLLYRDGSGRKTKYKKLGQQSQLICGDLFLWVSALLFT